MVTGFLHGLSSIKHTPFEAGLLPDAEKERLCRSLLAEFGVTQIQPGPNGELVHSCCLPSGRHKNGDSNPSASLNYLKLTYICRGCGNSGGLLWFIAFCRGEDAGDASSWLARETGTDGTVQDLGALMEFFDALYGPTSSASPPIPRLDRSVLDPWMAIHPYMTEMRHIPEETLRRFLVGYGTLRIKVGEDEWVSSERIVIPHFWEDDLVGWQTRRLYGSDGTPRWKSSLDFPKDVTIYNYSGSSDDAVVVESPMSVLRRSHHIPSVEATFGASITVRQIRLLGRHRRLVLWFDNDEAGWVATEQAGAALEPYCRVWAVANPYAADPADFEDALAEHLVSSAVP